MNEMTVLREIGADLDPPVTEPPDRLRERVLSGIAGQPRRRLSLPSFGWRVALVGGFAVALAAGLIAAQTLSLGDRPPAINAEAAEILDNAAVAARMRPDLVVRPDQFVFRESISTYATIAVQGGNTTTTIESKRQRSWHSVDGTREGVEYQRALAGGEWVESAIPGCRDGKTVLSEGAQPGHVPDCEILPAYLHDMPTAADAMYRYLFDNSHGGNPANVQAFITVADLLRQNYVQPSVMAAMFEATAKIPGATVVHDAVDLAGRHGIAVAQTHNAERHELIFDARTYQYLGERQVVVKDTKYAKAGTVIGGAAMLRIAIVDRAGELPR